MELARQHRLTRGLSHTTWRVAILTFLGTGLGVLLVANLSLGEKKIDQTVPASMASADPQFVRAMGVLLGPALVRGNRVEALVNGDQIFPAMLEAIRGARKTHHLRDATSTGRATIGKQFADALAERARAGVKVHVLLDWVGSRQDGQGAARARWSEAGVRGRRLPPARTGTTSRRMNNRTHRKLLVVDGRVGFTGGVGIADEWAGNAQDPEHWRDTHFRIEGPAVAQMQAAFIDNWIKATGDVLHGADYFPALERRRRAPAQMFSSSPRRRRREHAAHVPAVDRRGAALDPPLDGVLRAGRLTRCDAGRGR